MKAFDPPRADHCSARFLDSLTVQPCGELFTSRFSFADRIVFVR
jgi:hypothetical protein